MLSPQHRNALFVQVKSVLKRILPDVSDVIISLGKRYLSRNTRFFGVGGFSPVC